MSQPSHMSLVALLARLGGWPVPEVSGRVKEKPAEAGNPRAPVKQGGTLAGQAKRDYGAEIVGAPNKYFHYRKP